MVLFNDAILKLVYQCSSITDDTITYINDLSSEINLLLGINDNVDDFVMVINNNNNVVHANILVKEILDMIWVSLGVAGYITNNSNEGNDNYVLCKDGFIYLYQCYIKSIFNNTIVTNDDVCKLLMKLIDIKWQYIEACFNRNSQISVINIFIFYHLLYEAVDVIFEYLDKQYHPSFLWVLLNNIIDINADGGRCRHVNSIKCILDVHVNNEMLSLSLTQDTHDMATEYVRDINKMKRMMYSEEQHQSSISSSTRRPTTANDAIYSRNKDLAKEILQLKESGVPFSTFVASDRSSIANVTRPSSASVVPTAVKTTQHDTVGITKWASLKNLLKQRQQLIDAGEEIHTTFIEDWKPIISASLLSDFERQRAWKGISSSRPQSPDQLNTTSQPKFSPINRPKSSNETTTRPISGRPIKEEVKKASVRPKSSPSTRPKSSTPSRREKNMLLEYGNPDFNDEVIGAKKQVYKILEMENNGDGDADQDSVVEIADIADKLMASTTDSIKLEKSIDHVSESKSPDGAVAVDLNAIPGGELVSLQDFLFKPETFYLKQPRSPSSPTAAELPHFSSFLDEQQHLKVTLPSDSNKREQSDVSHITHTYAGRLSPKQSDHSLLRNLSIDVDGGLSLEFIPTPSMYSNVMVDSNTNFTDNNALFSRHGGSYLEANIDPAMKSLKQESINMNQESSIVSEFDKKYRLEDYSASYDDVFLEISGKGSPLLLKEKQKKMMDDYGSITDSSKGSPSNQQLLSRSFKRIISNSNLTMLDNIMDDIEDIKDIDQNSISPVSSVVVKLVNDKQDYMQAVGHVMGSSASVNTVTDLLQTNTLSKSNMALAPVALDQLGRSLSLPNGIHQNVDVVLDTCVRKELRFRDTKNTLVTKFRSKVNSNPANNVFDNNDQKASSLFLNDPKYPKIKLTSSHNPWKPIFYNHYIDPLLNGSPWTWEERKLSQVYLNGDINHMNIDAKRQSASRAAFENYVDEKKIPAIVKYKRNFRKVPQGLFGKKKPLNDSKVIPPSKKNKGDKREQKKSEESVVIPVITRRSAFIQGVQPRDYNLLVPRVFQ